VKPHARPEPSQGRAQQTGLHETAPAAQRAPRDARVNRAAKLRPLLGCRSAVPQHVHDGFDDRGQGRPPAPQLRRHQGRRRTRAESDPQDRHVAEHRARGQVAHALTQAPAVRPRTSRGPAGRAGQTRRRQQAVEPTLPTRHRGDVVSQVRCEYIVDCLEGGHGAGRSPKLDGLVFALFPSGLDSVLRNAPHSLTRPGPAQLLSVKAGLSST